MKRINERFIEAVFDPDMKMRAREHFEKVIREQIIEEGYVPVLDRDTLWYTGWDEDKDRYTCKIVVFCVYVGKRKARDEIAGYNEASGKLVNFNGQFQ